MAEFETLDTSRWNLFSTMTTARAAMIPWIAAFGLAGCGPVAGGQPDDGSGSASEGTSSGSPPSSTGQTTEPQQCQSDDDCGYGYACIDGICEYQCYCACGVAPPGGDRFRCSEGGFYDCESDADCSDGDVCSDGSCEPGPESCALIPTPQAPIALEFGGMAGQSARSLAFADAWSAAPGDELFVLRGNTIEAVSEGTGVVVVDSPTDVVDFAVGDVSGDGIADLVVITTEAVSVWRGTDGGFSAPDTTQIVAGATQPRIGDRDGDGIGDVYVLADSGVVVLPTEAGVPLASVVMLSTAPSEAFELAEIGASTTARVVYSVGNDLWLIDEATSAEPVQMGVAAGDVLRRFTIADFASDGQPDLLAFSDQDVLSSFVDLPTSTAVSGSFSAGVGALAHGEIDGDGRADIAFVSSVDARLELRFGGEDEDEFGPREPLRCPAAHDLPAPGHAVAIGDLLGDGSREVAIASDTDVWLIGF